MRIKNEKIDIDYNKTKEFYESRGEKYNTSYPYVTTMNQDSNPQLTEARNQEEVRKILPLLELDGSSQILDMGCGIGRWADSINCPIASYLGVDFSENLIQIARSRNTKDNFSFEKMSICDFKEYFESNHLHPFNRLIIAGVFACLNDADVESVLQFLTDILTSGAIVYIREPVGIQERLTLKDFYSQELAHDYNVIYRSVMEYQQLFRENASMFTVVHEGFLFDTSTLNNRKETSQYYFILRKGTD